MKESGTTPNFQSSVELEKALFEKSKSKVCVFMKLFGLRD